MNDTAIEIYKLLQKKFPLISKPQSFPSRFISPILLCILSISKWSNITYMSHTLLCPLDIFQNNNLPFKPCVVSFITMGSRENYVLFYYILQYLYKDKMVVKSWEEESMNLTRRTQWKTPRMRGWHEHSKLDSVVVPGGSCDLLESHVKVVITISERETCNLWSWHLPSHLVTWAQSPVYSW